jgi:hypothetical protein
MISPLLALRWNRYCFFRSVKISNFAAIDKLLMDLVIPPTIKPWKILRKGEEPPAGLALNFSLAGKSFAKTSGGRRVRECRQGEFF